MKATTEPFWRVFCCIVCLTEDIGTLREELARNGLIDKRREETRGKSRGSSGIYVGQESLGANWLIKDFIVSSPTVSQINVGPALISPGLF